MKLIPAGMKERNPGMKLIPAGPAFMNRAGTFLACPDASGSPRAGAHDHEQVIEPFVVQAVTAR